MASITPSINGQIIDKITEKVIEKGFKQQIILAVYLNIPEYFGYEETENVIRKTQETFDNNKVNNSNIIHYIIPVKDQPTKIECIYPKFSPTRDELVKDFKDSIDNLGDKYHDFFRHLFSFKNELLIEKVK